VYEDNVQENLFSGEAIPINCTLSQVQFKHSFSKMGKQVTLNFELGGLCVSIINNSLNRWVALTIHTPASLKPAKSIGVLGYKYAPASFAFKLSDIQPEYYRQLIKILPNGDFQEYLENSFAVVAGQRFYFRGTITYIID
jgi:hypothetical protein